MTIIKGNTFNKRSERIVSILEDICQKAREEPESFIGGAEEVIAQDGLTIDIHIALPRMDYAEIIVNKKSMVIQNAKD